MNKKLNALVIAAVAASFSLAYASDNGVNFTKPQKIQLDNYIDVQQLTVDQLSDSPVKQPTEKPVKHPTTKPVKKPTVKPVKQLPTIEELVEQPSSNNTSIEISESPIDIENLVVPLSTAPNAAEISNIISTTPLSIVWHGTNYKLRSPNAVSNLYQQLGFHPLWTDNGVITTLAGQMIKIINQAKYQALKPATYHQNALSAFEVGQAVSSPEKFDILLTDAFVTYTSHLKRGILSPKSQFPTWNTPAKHIDYLGLYQQANDGTPLNRLLVVDNHDYYVLQQAYQKIIDNKSEAAAKPKIAYLQGKKSGLAVQQLRKRLGLDASIDVYDIDLKQAVKAYQAKNGLQADGIAGTKTINHLNRNSSMNPEKLAINMERLRWTQIPHNRNYIWVNIPAYYMAVKNNDKTVFNSRVIVGRNKRPTPIFSDHLEYVVLAPYWNVPSTIFKEDKLPKLKKNSNAFAGRLDVINTATGAVVKASSVNWKNGGKGYRLRQKPGARNSLGRMKFLFPNKHAIYLHDTPSRHLFKRSKRALSSGCVRVQRAEDLALFLLKDMGYDRSRIKKESRRSKEKWVTLNEKSNYPVFLNYYTTWVDKGGELRNAYDIYGYDKKMKVAYRNKLKNL